jgi:hypothetical protein
VRQQILLFSKLDGTSKDYKNLQRFSNSRKRYLLHPFLPPSPPNILHNILVYMEVIRSAGSGTTIERQCLYRKNDSRAVGEMNRPAMGRKQHPTGGGEAGTRRTIPGVKTPFDKLQQ